MRCDLLEKYGGENGALFQSLSGFLMRCDDRRIRQDDWLEAFQSLSGFLMRCDGRRRSDRGTRGTFQSLSGFLMRCDRNDIPALPHAEGLVSIPIGFSDAL